MSFEKLTDDDKLFTKRMIDAAIKIGAIILLVSWCFDILKPFILPIAWGAILAVTLYPLCMKLTDKLGGKKGLSAGLIALVGISILIVPTWNLSSSMIESVQHVASGIKEGTLDVPEPDSSVKEWPLVGEKIYQAWFDASDDIEAFATKNAEKLKGFASQALSAVAGIGGGILQFVVSLIIAAIFMAKSEPCAKGVEALMTRLMSAKGKSVLVNSVATVRSVAQGILGIAFTQAILAAIGLIIADIPGAGIWVIAVLLLAIVQLPPILILGPISAYYFSIADTTPAVIFLVYNLIVSASDGFLKPLLLGRGTNTPMLVILLGAIGGMIVSGIIGLFVGAVVLALGYELMMDWLDQHPENNTSDKNNLKAP